MKSYIIILMLALPTISVAASRKCKEAQHKADTAYDYFVSSGKNSLEKLLEAKKAYQKLGEDCPSFTSWSRGGLKVIAVFEGKLRQATVQPRKVAQPKRQPMRSQAALLYLLMLIAFIFTVWRGYNQQSEHISQILAATYGSKLKIIWPWQFIFMLQNEKGKDKAMGNFANSVPSMVLFALAMYYYVTYPGFYVVKWLSTWPNAADNPENAVLKVFGMLMIAIVAILLAFIITMISSILGTVYTIYSPLILGVNAMGFIWMVGLGISGESLIPWGWHLLPSHFAWTGWAGTTVHYLTLELLDYLDV